MYTLQEVSLLAFAAFLFGLLVAAAIYVIGTLRRPEQQHGVALPTARHRSGLSGH